MLYLSVGASAQTNDILRGRPRSAASTTNVTPGTSWRTCGARRPELLILILPLLLLLLLLLMILIMILIMIITVIMIII